MVPGIRWGVYFKVENLKAGVAELGLAGRRFFSERFAAPASPRVKPKRVPLPWHPPV